MLAITDLPVARALMRTAAPGTRAVPPRVTILTMTDHARRRELSAAYRETPRRAGIFLIRNTTSGRTLVASSLDLDSEQHKLEFARTTGSTGVFHRVIVPDVERLGWAAFTLEIVEELPASRERTAAQTRDDLATLVALWREKVGPALLY